jgi:fucose 4-O-acetylase-like acetyltransferase
MASRQQREHQDADDATRDAHRHQAAEWRSMPQADADENKRRKRQERTTSDTSRISTQKAMPRDATADGNRRLAARSSRDVRMSGASVHDTNDAAVHTHAAGNETTMRATHTMRVTPGNQADVASSASRARHAENGHRDPVMTTFYAIAGLLVVASHAHGAIDIATNTLPLYSYQIGMFLFASGWFYHERHEQHPIAWAWKRIKRLIVPLFAINAAYGVIGNLVVPVIGYEFIPPMSFDTLVRQPMLGGDMFMLDNPLWFVFPFFCATTFDFAIHAVLDAIRNRIVRDGNSTASLAIDVGLASAYTLAFVIIGTLPGFVSPPPSSKHALMVRVLFMLPLIAYGRVVSHHVPRIAKANASTSVLMIFVSLCVALLMDTLIGDTAFLAARASFPAGPIPPLITSMCGIIAWLGVSQLIGDKVGRLSPTDALARSTMSLMANQIAGFELLNLLFLGLDNAGIVNGFETQKFVTDIWYELRPIMPNTVNGTQVGDAFGFLYLIAGVLFAMLLSGIARKVSKTFRRRNGLSY